MARPKMYQEDRVTTAVRMPQSLHQRLQEVAAERDLSVNLLVLKAVERYLATLPSVDEVTTARSA